LLSQFTCVQTCYFRCVQGIQACIIFHFLFNHTCSCCCSAYIHFQAMYTTKHPRQQSESISSFNNYNNVRPLLARRPSCAELNWTWDWLKWCKTWHCRWQNSLLRLLGPELLGNRFAPIAHSESAGDFLRLGLLNPCHTPSHHPKVGHSHRFSSAGQRN